MERVLIRKGLELGFWVLGERVFGERVESFRVFGIQTVLKSFGCLIVGI